jgi:hypothetical protein
VSDEAAAFLDRVRVVREYARAVRDDLEAIPTGAAADARDVEWLRGIALYLADDLERAHAALEPLATSPGLQVLRDETVSDYMGTPGRTIQQARWRDISTNNPAASYFNAQARDKRELLRSRTLARDASRFVSPGATRAS